MELLTFSTFSFFALFFETTLSTVFKSHQIHADYNRVNTVEKLKQKVFFIFEIRKIISSL